MKPLQALLFMEKRFWIKSKFEFVGNFIAYLGQIKFCKKIKRKKTKRKRKTKKENVTTTTKKALIILFVTVVQTVVPTYARK